MNTRSAIAALLFAAGIAACASSPDAEAPAAAATLSEEAFAALLKAANDAKTQPAREAALTALIARDDLTDDQLAEAYYTRGFLRGNFVRDDIWAYPQCAVVDYMKMQELAPNHRLIPFMEEDRDYQFDRFQYPAFDSAPQECKDAAADAFWKVHG